MTVAQHRQPDLRLFSSYRPLRGVPDELADAQGKMRPAWSGLIDHLSRLTDAEIAHDFAQGDQHLADAGVFFRKYGDISMARRDWPYSHVPIILPEAEWDTIAAGLIQRADLLEKVVADIYGPNRLIADRLLPPALIAQNPEWLRPMVGVPPRSGHYLHFLAFEIGRGPDGRWWVLSDRVDAPSGAGFALENRVATTRVFPELYARSHVHRLAGFFRLFREALDQQRGANAGRIGLLTPGPLTDTYYEQAYIARYLGMVLLEGEDLTVEDGHLWVRTVQGLSPIDVLWRRLDSVWIDPLELDETSRLGTPGLLAAIRAGHVSMVNALGVGVLETQALMAFLPAISRALTGKSLALPHVATWWCGQASELAHVRANASRMMIGPAMSTRMPYDSDQPFALGGVLQGQDGDLDTWLSNNAANLVAKELVTLSTTPVYTDGILVPRPMSLRMFLARTAQGWQMMPGGFGRISHDSDTTAISMRHGGSVADVWVVSDKPVESATLLARPDGPFVRARPDPLPSRAADNLFWLGRYVERTEGCLRLVRAWHSRRDEAPAGPLADLLRDQLDAYGLDVTKPVPDRLISVMGAAVGSASKIRDRFSVDGWAALKDLEKTMGRMAHTAQAGTDASLAVSVLLRKVAGFSGLVHENMFRATGWQFLSLGRSLERAAMMADLLANAADPDAPPGGLDFAIEIGDSTMVHRQRYALVTTRETVVDLLALDDQNPRAILFHLDVMRRRVADLSAGRDNSQMSDFDRKVLALHTTVTLQTPQGLDTAGLRRVHSDILDLSAALYAAFLR